MLEPSEEKMKVQAAALSISERKFVVVLVGMELLQTPGEADLAVDSLEPSFGGVRVVLMAQNEGGSPTYHGERELLELLEDVPVDKMPWREHTVA